MYSCGYYVSRKCGFPKMRLFDDKDGFKSYNKVYNNNQHTIVYEGNGLPIRLSMSS